MTRTRYWMLASICVSTLLGCGGGQRDQIIANQDAIQADLRRAHEELLQGQEEAAKRDREILSVARMGVSNTDQILTLASDTNAAVKENGETLGKAYTEIYGVGVDLRSAIGETRLVIEVNDDTPLRVHSDVPSAESTVVARMPIGAVIFQARKVTERWWRGVIFQEGEKTEVYFAVNFTKPLREELMAADTGLEVGASAVD